MIRSRFTANIQEVSFCGWRFPPDNGQGAKLSLG